MSDAFHCPRWPECGCPDGTMVSDCPGLVTAPPDAPSRHGSRIGSAVRDDEGNRGPSATSEARPLRTGQRIRKSLGRLVWSEIGRFAAYAMAWVITLALATLGVTLLLRILP